MWIKLLINLIKANVYFHIIYSVDDIHIVQNMWTEGLHKKNQPNYVILAYFRDSMCLKFGNYTWIISSLNYLIVNKFKLEMYIMPVVYLKHFWFKQKYIWKIIYECQFFKWLNEYVISLMNLMSADLRTCDPDFFSSLHTHGHNKT